MRLLPTLNALLNGIAALLLLAGWFAIRAGRRELHKRLMLGACAASGLFLVSYLIYHAQIGGGKPFRGTGAIRPVYFVILVSHIVGAAALLYLVPALLRRAWREEFDRHRRLARVGLPIWLYVSVTGVLTYIFLYLLYP